MRTRSALDIYTSKEEEYNIDLHGTAVHGIIGNDNIDVFAHTGGVAPVSIRTGIPREVESIRNWSGLQQVTNFETNSTMPLSSLKLLIDNLPNLKALKVGSFEVGQDRIQELTALLSKIECLSIKKAFSSNQTFEERPVYTITLPVLKCFFYTSNMQVPILDFENCELFYFAVENYGETSKIQIVPREKNTCLITECSNCKFTGFDYLISLRI